LCSGAERWDKVLDVVSTAIHGGGAAVNAQNQRRGFLRPLNFIVSILSFQ